jgi:hypothetical protein
MQAIMEMLFKDVLSVRFILLRCSIALPCLVAYATVCIIEVQILCAYAKLALLTMEAETAQRAQQAQLIHLVGLINAQCVLQRHGNRQVALVTVHLVQIKPHLPLVPPAPRHVYVFVELSPTAWQIKRVLHVWKDVSKKPRVQHRVLYVVLEPTALDLEIRIALGVRCSQPPEISNQRYLQIVFVTLAQKQNLPREHACHAKLAFIKVQ